MNAEKKNFTFVVLLDEDTEDFYHMMRIHYLRHCIYCLWTDSLNLML